MNPAPPVTSACEAHGAGSYSRSAGTRPPEIRVPGHDGHARADDRVVAQRDLGLQHRVAADAPSCARGCRATTRAPSCRTAPSSSAPASTIAPAPSTDRRTRARASMRAPSPTRTGASIERAGLDRRRRPAPRRRARPRARRARAAGRRDPRARRVRLQVLLGRTDVEPVAAAAVAEEQARLREHAREDLALDRHIEPGRDAIEELGLEHVRAGVDPVARRLARRGLLDERDHAAVVLGRHDTERARVVDLGQRDRRLRAALVVEPHHRGEIEVGEHVAVADDEALVDPVGREADRAGGAERLVLDRVAQRDVAEHVVADTSSSCAEVRVERVGQVAHRQHDLVDAVATRASRVAVRDAARWRSAAAAWASCTSAGAAASPHPRRGQPPSRFGRHGDAGRCGRRRSAVGSRSSEGAAGTVGTDGIAFGAVSRFSRARQVLERRRVAEALDRLARRAGTR